MLNIDGDQISIAIDLDQGARLASVQWRDMQFVVPFRGQDLTWGWFSMSPFACLLYTSPSPRDRQKSRMPSSA